MPAFSDPTGTRLVPMTRERAEWIVQHLEECERCGSTGHADLGDEIKAAYGAAPADPAEAIHNKLVALREGERGPSVREVGWRPTLPDFELQLIADDTAAVLAALGCVVERPANTGDHHA